MHINKKHLDMNQYSRSGIPLERCTGLVIHYTDSATSTFSRNIDWLYEFLNKTRPAQKRFASYNYVIDQDGEVYELIPPTECAWHAGPTSETDPIVSEELGGRPNWSTIGIAFLHPTPDGQPTEASYKSLVKLCAILIKEYNIPFNNILRHYDCTKKNCPKHYVTNHDEWAIFQQNVITTAFTLSGGYI